MSTFAASRSELNRKRVIFVDDEPFALEVLQRIFESLRHEWHMEFVNRPQDALIRLDELPFDAIVSDLQMPEMNGAELLERVAESHPAVSRIILSAHADEDLVLQSVNVAHQFISKTADPRALIKKVRKLLLMRQPTFNTELVETICAIERLPSMPDVYCELVKAVGDPEANLRDLAHIVERDPAICAKLLQLANSAFFGLRGEVSSISDAICFLGLETLRYLVLMVGVCEQFDSAIFPRGFVEGVWNHSIQTASIARLIAESEHTSLAMAEQSFVAGLLHDLGKLILAENFAKTYAEAVDFANALDRPLWKAERQILKATHADVGAYLLDLWGLPETVTRAVAMHHEPVARDGESLTPLAIVHVANHLAHELSGDVAHTELNTEFLEKTGLIDRVSAWRGTLDHTAAAAMA
jgi:putative nucleotidyltransferase with HDIG domain